MFDISPINRRCTFKLSHAVDESIVDVHRRRIDTLYASTYGDNEFGWPCSELTFIENCQDVSLKRALNDSLVSFPVDGSPSNLSTSEILDSWRSRYAQSPSELERFIKVEVPAPVRSVEEKSDVKEDVVSVSDTTVSD